MTVDSLPAHTDGAPAPAPEPTTPPPRSPLSLLGLVAPFLVLLGTFAVLAKRASQPLSNADTYFHLTFGHEFLDGDWSLRHPGSVTTFGTNDWVPTQWLPQVVMAQLEDWFGLAGVAWFAGFLHLEPGGDTVVHRPPARQPAGQHRGGRRRPARGLTGPVHAAAGRSATCSSPSPRLPGSPPAEDRKVRWWLVPLTWVWAMMHGMWPVGILIGLRCPGRHRAGPGRDAAAVVPAAPRARAIRRGRCR